MNADNEQRKLLSRIRAASDVWAEIENEPLPADRWIGNFFYQNRKKFGSRDRRFISQAVYNLFRHKTYLNLWAEYLGRPRFHRDFYVILSAYLDGMLSFPEARGLSDGYLKENSLGAELPKLTEFSLPPGVSWGSPEEYLSLRYSYPLWLVKRWSGLWGAEKTERILRVFEGRPHLIVRTNPLKVTREKLLRSLEKRGTAVRASGATPWGIVFEERQPVFEWEEFQDGLFEVQDTGSQLACMAVDAKPGEMVWDVCAGGGGKSLLLAAMMENKGRLVATDIRPKKLEDLKKRAKRAGVFNIFPADLNRMKEISGARRGFDKILVDAPCSGTGTLRRNPDAKWKMSEERFQTHQNDQLAIVRSVLPYLKKGGKLIYVTCSMEAVEDEEVMEKILADSCGELREAAASGIPAEKTAFGARLWPGEENDGFFIGVAEKI